MQAYKLLTSILITMGISLISCNNDLFQPDKDNHSGEDRLLTDPAFAEGILLNAYANLPNSYAIDETATDDAVTNIEGSNYRRIATGEWSDQFDPLSIWNTAYRQLYYLNYFLSINDKVDYAWDDRGSSSDAREEAFRRRFKGEALALRAWYNFELLKRHGGIATDGQPTGFVIVKAVIDKNADFNLPRNSYEDCVEFILADIDTAITLLPDVYTNQGDDIIHNAVFGEQNRNRVNGQFAKALRSRLALLVASQSFNNDPNRWEIAAIASSGLLTKIGGVSGLSQTGHEFWKNENDSEILFRRDYQTINSREIANFPPSLFGRGETNPSQNLTDAFPMANGYPIDSELSDYDPEVPYINRDPRLSAYIIYSGNNFNGRVIEIEAASQDGLNQTIASTRTGYYLKKLLQPTVNLTPTVMSTARHFYTLFRYTEMFLNYAEAANEAWGPNADPKGYGFTPVDIISAIRQRGGISQPDNYLSIASSSKETMRELIRNERRIELCFEGFRFWDLRRWNLNLNERVNGVSTQNGKHTIVDVEERAFQPFMNYGPIPKLEILKANKIIQNQGW